MVLKGQARGAGSCGVYPSGMTLARNVILGFLRDRSQPLCAPCLTKLTGLSSHRLVDGWRDLAELSADYRVSRGRCADCHEIGDVLGLVAS